MQVNAEGQTLIVQQNTRCLPRRSRVVHCTISTRQSYCQTQYWYTERQDWHLVEILCPFRIPSNP